MCFFVRSTTINYGPWTLLARNTKVRLERREYITRGQNMLRYPREVVMSSYEIEAIGSRDSMKTWAPV